MWDAPIVSQVGEACLYGESGIQGTHGAQACHRWRLKRVELESLTPPLVRQLQSRTEREVRPRAANAIITVARVSV